MFTVHTIMFTVNIFVLYYIMDRICAQCGKVFRDPTALKRHSIKKLPCVVKLEPSIEAKHPCPNCNRDFTTETAKYRHIRINCRVVREKNMMIDQLTAKVQLLERQLHAETTPTVINNINNVANTTVNTVNHVTIAPWGSPLQLTDADVEAALATVPGLAGNTALPEVVAVLMDLVKRSHIPEAARNVHINPKRCDQALALTATGWAALPLAEATMTLFDGASARIAAPMPRQQANPLRETLPMQYRADKDAAVQLGLRPMEAHLANIAPGGPGPLLIAAQTAVPQSAVPQSAVPQSAEPQMAVPHVERVKMVLRTMPIRCGPSGALKVDWIVAASQAAGLSGRELFIALAAGDAELAKAWEAAQIYTAEK